MDMLSRRGFLERTLSVAAAATAGIGADEAARAASQPGGVRRVGANDRLRVAVFGVHGRGKSHLEAYARRSDVEIVAIADPDESVGRKGCAFVEAAGKPAPKAFQDLRRVLDDRSIDIVSIATPNHWHALASIWAMQAGKDVYVEKPVSHNVSEGRRMVEAARKYNRICQAGTQIRSSKGSRDAIEFIHSGKIGKVTVARGLCYKRRESIGSFPDGEVPSGVDYDIWQGPAPARPFNANRFHYNWHWNWAYGNGDMGNQGIHQMDVARWALNKETLPRSVWALGGRFGYVDAGETPNTELAFFDYGDSHLIFEVRGLPTRPLRDVTVGNIVYGSTGLVAFTGYDEAIAIDYHDNVIATFAGGGDHFGNFLSAVRSRNISDMNGEILEGHLSSALCHLGNISYRLGTAQPFNAKTKAFGDDREAYGTFGRFEKHLAENKVKIEATTYKVGPRLAIDAAHERFRGNDAANGMLTREYRAPFVVPEHV